MLGNVNNGNRRCPWPYVNWNMSPAINHSLIESWLFFFLTNKAKWTQVNVQRVNQRRLVVHWGHNRVLSEFSVNPHSNVLISKMKSILYFLITSFFVHNLLWTQTRTLMNMRCIFTMQSIFTNSKLVMQKRWKEIELKLYHIVFDS